MRTLSPLNESVAPGANVVGSFRRNEAIEYTPIERKLDLAWHRLGEHVAATAERLGGLVIDHEAPVQENAEEESKITSRENTFINLLLGEAAIRQWRQEELEPIFKEIWSNSGRMTVLTLRRSGVPVSSRDRIQAVLLRLGGMRAGLIDITEPTRLSLFRVLDQSRAKGLNPKEAARLIRSEVPKGRFRHAGSAYRSKLIARTEILHSHRIGALKGYRESEVVEKVRAYDGVEHDECLARDGQIFTLDEADAETGNTHPNCVLAWGPDRKSVV